MKEKFSELIKQREEFRKKDKEVKDKERALIALCKQEKPNYEVHFFYKEKKSNNHFKRKLPNFWLIMLKHKLILN